MSSNDVDACLHRAVPERAALLMSMREDQWFERKSARVTPRRFAEALVGFGNAEGGVVIVGLCEGRVEDTKAEAKRMNELRQAPFNLVSPPVRTHFEVVEVVDDHDGPASVLVARVTPGDAVHELGNGDVYLRVGDSTIKLSPTQRQELMFDRGASQYEATPLADIAMSDLDADQLTQFRDAVGADPTSPYERQLQARSLLTVNDQVTVGAYLLFAPDPSVLLPHATVRILKYGATSRGTGTRQELLEGNDVRVHGSIPAIIHEASDIIDAWMPRRRVLQPDRTFAGTPIVPRDAWLEGLVNAVVHRSYSAAGDHIRVEIFPDRVEIESPGRFPGIVDPDHPLEIARYARNPRIARVCSDLAITQELGEGIKRMFDEMRANGLSDPIYKQTAGSVRLTLAAIARLDPQVEARLPRGANDVLKTLRITGAPMGTGELSESIGRARPSTLRILNALRDEGLVHWRGNSPKDPRATWELEGL